MAGANGSGSIYQSQYRTMSPTELITDLQQNMQTRGNDCVALTKAYQDITLPDGRKAQVQITITAIPSDFLPVNTQL